MKVADMHYTRAVRWIYVLMITATCQGGCSTIVPPETTPQANTSTLSRLTAYHRGRCIIVSIDEFGEIKVDGRRVQRDEWAELIGNDLRYYTIEETPRLPPIVLECPRTLTIAKLSPVLVEVFNRRWQVMFAVSTNATAEMLHYELPPSRSIRDGAYLETHVNVLASSDSELVVESFKVSKRSPLSERLTAMKETKCALSEFWIAMWRESTSASVTSVIPPELTCEDAFNYISNMRRMASTNIRVMFVFRQP